MDEEALRQMMEAFIPFNAFLGMKVRSASTEGVVMEIPFRDALVGDPLRPALHGGVLSALADTCGGAAVWISALDPRARVSTIDLRIDYLRPARLSTLVAEGKVVRLGNRVGVVDMRLHNAETPEIAVATGKGVYNISIGKR